MNDVTAIYRKRADRFAAQKAAKHSRIVLFGWLRVGVLLLGSGAIWALWGHGTGPILLSIFGALALFLVLIRIHLSLNADERYYARLEEINERELQALEGELSSFHEGVEFRDKEHPYAYDLDLFGQGSLYQLVERCGTREGRERLAKSLSTPELEAAKITERQVAVGELSEQLDWRQDILAFGSLAFGKADEIDFHIRDWFQESWKRLTAIEYALAWIFAAGSIAGVVLVSLDIITINHLLFYSVLPFGLVGLRVRQSTRVSGRLGRLSELVDSYTQLLHLVEDQEFKAPHLKAIQERLNTKGKKAHEQLKSLKAITNALESRNNLFVGILLNFLLIWDLHQLKRLDRWKSEFQANTDEWFEALGEMEALSSLATLHFNRQEFVFPTVAPNGPVLEAKGLGHPLIQKGRVDNDFDLKQSGSFSIVTGANMAGKSTFLRSVGINLILAMNGAPVCAQSYTFRPTYLFSSMRTDDSLQKQQSYFHSELIRLKQLVDYLQTHQPCFIVLDEILRGTNSKDKAAGSKTFLDRLINLKATGLIATHDLSLCTIETDYPELVQNECFEVDIVGDQMHCDYKLRSGICQNMNATFLMENMGITKANS